MLQQSAQYFMKQSKLVKTKHSKTLSYDKQ